MIKLKFKLNANILNILLSIYFCIFLNISCFKYIFNNMYIIDAKSMFFMLDMSALLFFIHYTILNIICIPYVFKFLVVLILLISSLANFYMNEYGVFIDTDMIRNVFETNTSEALDLVNLKFILNFIIFGVIPSVFISLQEIVYDKKFIRKKLLNIFYALIFVAVSAPIFYK